MVWDPNPLVHPLTGGIPSHGTRHPLRGGLRWGLWVWILSALKSCRHLNPNHNIIPTLDPFWRVWTRMETDGMWYEILSLGKHPLTGVIPLWDSHTLSEVPPGRPFDLRVLLSMPAERWSQSGHFVWLEAPIWTLSRWRS